MEYHRLLELRGYLEDLRIKGRLDNHQIIIFGSNEPAERMMDYFDELKIKVSHIIDNNEKKDGSILRGVNVSLPSKTLIPFVENATILISSKYYPEMLVQLANMGYREGEHIYKVLDYNVGVKYSLDDEEYNLRLEKLELGRKIYSDISLEHKDFDKLMICPLAVLGDTYLGISFMDEYIMQKKESKIVIVTHKGGPFKLPYLFGYEDRAVKLDAKEMEALIQYSIFMNLIGNKVIILNHRSPYTCRLGEAGNVKDIHFTDHFRYGVLGLDKGTKPVVPYVHRDDEVAKAYVDKLFKDHGLVRGKTVILLPYAKTATALPLEFWTELIKRLHDKGYTVCTNQGGDGEPALDGTIELFYDVRYALETIEASGAVIGLRSGLCDVLSTANATKIIIYPDRLYGPDSFMKFFSLNRMQLCDDAIEYEWKEDIGLVDVIMKEF
ncbi:MAG: hypothetical protein K5656_11850 [Lachnospiraceae bacterium]|nr:hypothetical protein [Lachnospiraceae bacterium]